MHLNKIKTYLSYIHTYIHIHISNSTKTGDVKSRVQVGFGHNTYTNIYIHIQVSNGTQIGDVKSRVQFSGLGTTHTQYIHSLTGI
jgi:hypothetical protein